MTNDYSFFNRLKDQWEMFRKSDTYIKLKGGDPDAPYDAFKPMRMDGRGQFLYLHLRTGRFCYKDGYRYETYYDRETGDLINSKEFPLLEEANRKNLEYSKIRGWKGFWKYLRTYDGRLIHPNFYDIEADDAIEIKARLRSPCRFEKKAVWSARWVDLSFQEYLKYALPQHFSNRRAKHIDQSLNENFLKPELYQRLLRRNAIAIDPKYYDNIIITDVEICDRILNEPLMASVFRERFKEELRYSYKPTFKDALYDLRDYGDYLRLTREDEKYIRAELEEYFYECHPERKEGYKPPITSERHCRVI